MPLPPTKKTKDDDVRGSAQIAARKNGASATVESVRALIYVGTDYFPQIWKMLSSVGV